MRLQLSCCSFYVCWCFSVLLVFCHLSLSFFCCYVLGNKMTLHQPPFIPADFGQKKQRKKSRWSSETPDQKTVIPGMPTVIPPGLTRDQERAYIGKFQIINYLNYIGFYCGRSDQLVIVILNRWYLLAASFVELLTAVIFSFLSV